MGLKWLNANSNALPEGIEPLDGKANYFIGRPDQWRTGVATFARIRYRDLYPGMDLIFYGNRQRLEYDLVAQPGADPSQALFQFEGATKMSLEANGDLRLEVGSRTFCQHKPLVYQETAGGRTKLNAAYILRSGMQVGIAVDDYDHSKALVIDPSIGAASEVGGSGLNKSYAVAVDANGNIYLSGSTTSLDFPLVHAVDTNFTGRQDAFVMEISSNGVVLFSTYLAGASDTASAQAVAVDPAGNAYAAGYTVSATFPTFNALQTNNAGGYDAFVAKLNPTGDQLLFSTYLGGKGADGANGMALDPGGNILVTGLTGSSNFPVTNGFQLTHGGGSSDAFVAKLSPDGQSLPYATFLGGSGAENDPGYNYGAEFFGGGAIAVDTDGNAYVTGWTRSTNFPTRNAWQPTNAAYDPSFEDNAFVTKLDSNGQLAFSTYFGGSGDEEANSIAVDFQQNVYIAGRTTDYQMPVSHALQAFYGGDYDFNVGDGFLAAFDATGTNLIYATYLGGQGHDDITAMTVRPTDGSVAVTGFTDSPGFPLLDPVQSSGEQGIFASRDGGATWASNGAGITSPVTYALKFDPLNPSVIYALLSSGCAKSVDGGATWVPANNGLGYVASPPGSVTTTSSSGSQLLAIDPVNEGVLYIAGYEGVYKSTNGGDLWTLSTNGFPSGPFLLDIVIDPQTPTTLYAGAFLHGVFKSMDGGINWFPINTGLNNMIPLSLLVDPLASSNVFVGLDEHFAGSSLFKSTNGGTNWTAVGNNIFNGPVGQLAANPRNLAEIYAIVYTGFESANLERSTNSGATWTTPYESAGVQFTALAFGASEVAAPELSIAQSGNNDIVSWPAAFGAFTLQTSPTLSPAAWQTVTVAVATNSGAVLVTNPISNGSGFYRLVSSVQAPPPTATIYLGTDLAGGRGLMAGAATGEFFDLNTVNFPGDTINDVAVNPRNPAIIYAALAGGYDAFVSVISPDGQLASSTYINGIGLDQGSAIAMLDPASVLVVGATDSPDFPTNSAPTVNQRLQPPNAAAPRDEESVTGDQLIKIFSLALHDLVRSCPSNQIKNIIIKHGEHLDVRDITWGGTIQFQGTLPPNTSLDTDTGSWEETGNLIEYTRLIVSGVITQHGTYTFSMKVTMGHCEWFVTYMITVT